MGKRVEVRYKGGSHYVAMKLIPAGTIFKAVVADLPGILEGVYIRGTSLTKATGGVHVFKDKQYLFVTAGNVAIDSKMEVV